ncbi:MAG: LacI family transcriptional regulator [Treponema sp.]|nr:LacI family transcriptional regulator [Treponema sp.]
MTIREIAEKVGVSIGTVDRVIHKRGRVSPETEQKIQAIIDTEGYQPNALARHLKINQKYLIGLLIPDLETEGGYWNLIYRGIIKGIEEFSAFSFDVRLFNFNRLDRVSLVKALSDMGASGCSAYIIAPIWQEETLLLLSEMEKPAPYFFIDSPLPGLTPESTIAQNPYNGGYLAGRLMELFCGTTGPFAVVRTYTAAFNLNERSRGFYDWFAPKRQSSVFDIVSSREHVEKMFTELHDVVFSSQGIKGIFVATSFGYKIADYIDSLGLKKNICIIGYDLIDENKICLKNGTIDCLISQRPEEQGRQAVFQVFKKLVLKESPDQNIEIPLDIFLKENCVTV